MKKEQFSSNGSAYITHFAKSYLYKSLSNEIAMWIQRFVVPEMGDGYSGKRPEAKRSKLYRKTSSEAAKSDNCLKLFKLMGYEMWWCTVVSNYYLPNRFILELFTVLRDTNVQQIQSFSLRWNQVCPGPKMDAPWGSWDQNYIVCKLKKLRHGCESLALIFNRQKWQKTFLVNNCI